VLADVAELLVDLVLLVLLVFFVFAGALRPSARTANNKHTKAQTTIILPTFIVLFQM
jgi:hypothetical protein